jgi:hypothetical protein
MTAHFEVPKSGCVGTVESAFARVDADVGDARKLSTSTDSDEKLHEIHQSVPVGLKVRQARYGFGIFATQFFPKGSVVYVGKQLIIPDEFAEFRLILDNQQPSEFKLDTETHSVQFTESQRWLYLFDSFMNHSCDPTTISRQNAELKRHNQYETVALKDVHPGDEITCDYNLFEYDCEGKVIEKCLCGFPNCVGRVAGFRYLSIDEQRKRIKLVDDEVFAAMTADRSNNFQFISDLRCPIDRVRIDTPDPSKPDFHRIVATRDFQVDEIVYRIDPLIFPEGTSIVIELNGHRKWIDNLVHTVSLGDGTRWFSYFDSFQNHSCDPSTKQVYLNETVFEMVALRPVKAGEELTCNYESFDQGFDGTSFQCQCGSANCRKTIMA